MLLISALFIPLIFVCSFSQYGHWEKLNPEHNPGYRFGHNLAKIGEKKILLFGGISYEGYLNDTWIFDLDSVEWYKINCKNSPTEREGLSMCQISEKRVLLFGGSIDSWDSCYNDLWYFDLDSMNWYKLNPKGYLDQKYPFPTYRAAMTKLNDSCVIIFGGIFEVSAVPKKLYSDDTWLYNINSNKWTDIVSQAPNGRSDHQMINLSNNQVLMFGGYNGHLLHDALVYYDTIKDWIYKSHLIEDLPALSGNGCAKLNDSISILFGGYTNTTINQENDSTWLFEHNKGKWIKQDLSNHPVWRLRLRIANIDENKVLMYGGGTGKIIEPDDTWLFILDSIPISVTENQNILPVIKSYINSNNELILDYYLPESGKPEIEIFNINGISVFKSENIQTQRGWNREIIHVDKLPAGVYFVRVRSGSLNLVEKFLVY